MKRNPRELRSQREEFALQARKLMNTAERARRELTPVEASDFDRIMRKVEALDIEIEELERSPTGDLSGGSFRSRPDGSLASEFMAQGFGRSRLSDDETRSLAAFIRTGDAEGLRELRASNNTSMNIWISQKMIRKECDMNQTRNKINKSIFASAIGNFS